MELTVPPLSIPDWHLVLRYSVYPEWSKLHCYTYDFQKAPRSPSRALWTPIQMDRPTSDWDLIQGLAFGVDLLTARAFP